MDAIPKRAEQRGSTLGDSFSPLNKINNTSAQEMTSQNSSLYKIDTAFKNRLSKYNYKIYYIIAFSRN